MNPLAIVSCLLALAWLPLAARFNQGWKSRKNPVSLAICAAMLLFSYTNVLFAFALAGQSSWNFFAIATHIFNFVVVVNFYICFRWSDKKFHSERAGERDSGSIPVPNSTSTPRGS